MIQAYGFQITKHQYELIEKILTFISSTEEKKIIDLQNYDAVPDRTTIIITFGALAAKRVPVGATFRLELPDVSHLVPQPGNQETRDAALKSCALFKERLVNKPVTITQADLSTGPINKKLWSFNTKDGKKVIVTDGQAEQAADLILSFEELYSLTTLVDKLGVSDIEITKGK